MSPTAEPTATFFFNVYFKKKVIMPVSPMVLVIVALIDFEKYRRWLAWNEDADDVFYMAYYNASLAENHTSLLNVS